MERNWYLTTWYLATVNNIQRGYANSAKGWREAMTQHDKNWWLDEMQYWTDEYHILVKLAEADNVSLIGTGGLYALVD